jgi:cytochrome c556
MRHALVWIALAAGCGSTQPALPAHYHWDSESELSNFMKKRINPPFSKLSFLLFHGEESPREELAGVAGELASAADELHTWPSPPGDSPQARQVFFEYAAAMKVDGIQLVLAVRAGDQARAQQRFEKLREKCDSCHHFFRFGQ